MTSKSTFVLVHGAWCGGWCWQRVADILRNRGHHVTTPTLTGVGERSHLLSKAITLATHVDDIVNHLDSEHFENVVLVGHSYGGAPVTGVADLRADRIGHLIYLDAAFLESGRALFDDFPSDIVEARIKTAEETSGGLTLPPPPLEHFGITDPGDIAFLEARLRPQPIRTYQTSLTLSGPVGNGLSVSYIACTYMPFPTVASFPERARRAGWPVSEIATGHFAMVTAPDETADLLEQLGGQK